MVQILKTPLMTSICTLFITSRSASSSYIVSHRGFRFIRTLVFPASRTMSSSAPRASKKPPHPSASILLISPKNEILLLHRVKTSSAFPSAHVFPGGNLTAEQDGAIPEIGDPKRHEDGETYRVGAIRECFEECGIILATNEDGSGRLLEVDDAEREKGRREVHGNKKLFKDWIREKGGVLDIEGLIPFTRWVTPMNVPKRFTTQMYIYFLPLSANAPCSTLPSKNEAIIPTPTSDGGLEHTAARFLPITQWLDMARSGEIILFPPQFFLMHLLEPILSPTRPDDPPPDNSILKSRRNRAINFVKSGSPAWTEKCISPTQVMRLEGDGRAVLGLEKPGDELKGSGRVGEFDRVVLVHFAKEGPRRVEVAYRKDIFEQAKQKANL